MKEFFLKYIKETIEQEGYFIAALFLLNLTAIFNIVMIIIEKTPVILTIIAIILANSLIVIFTIAIFIHLFNKIKFLKMLLKIFFLTAWTIIFLIDVFLLYKFRDVLRNTQAEILMTTNLSSIEEFLKDYIFKFDTLIFAIVVITIGFLIIRFFNDILQRLTKVHSPLSKKIFVALATLIVTTNFIIGNKCMSFYIVTNVGRAIYYSYYSYEFIGNKEKIFNKVQNAHDEIINDGSNIPYVIFILGESNDRNHMQIYNYDLPTTPLLKSRYDNGEILRFNDVIACGNNTTAVMLLLFNFAEKDTNKNVWLINYNSINEQDIWYNKPNLFNILKECNYHTAWLSNQSAFGTFGSLDELYSKCCNEAKFTETIDHNLYYEERTKDEALLTTLDESLAKNFNEKNFYVLHLEGTHQQYDKRYPKTFSKFTASDESKNSEEGRITTAKYDNAMLYNDYIVDEIIKRFINKDAVVIYISDHGEEVYDNREFSGHSIEEEGNFHMIEIPMLVWASSKFKINHAEKWNAMKKSIDKPYMTDDMIHSLLDLMSIKTTSYEPSKSIFNDNFDETRPRIYNGKIYTKSN